MNIKYITEELSKWDVNKDNKGMRIVYYNNIPFEEIIHCVAELCLSNNTDTLTVNGLYDEECIGIADKLITDNDFAKTFYETGLILSGSYNDHLEKTLSIGEDMKTEKLSFGQALEAIKQGKRVRRTGWHNKNGYISYVPETENTGAYISIHVDNDVLPWVASQSDLLSNDWRVI